MKLGFQVLGVRDEGAVKPEAGNQEEVWGVVKVMSVVVVDVIRVQALVDRQQQQPKQDQ